MRLRAWGGRVVPDQRHVGGRARVARAPFGAKLRESGTAQVADCCSNSIRVVKTAVQTAAEPVGYPAGVENFGRRLRGMSASWPRRRRDPPPRKAATEITSQVLRGGAPYRRARRPRRIALARPRGQDPLQRRVLHPLLRHLEVADGLHERQGEEATREVKRTRRRVLRVCLTLRFSRALRVWPSGGAAAAAWIVRGRVAAAPWPSRPWAGRGGAVAITSVGGSRRRTASWRLAGRAPGLKRRACT